MERMEDLDTRIKKAMTGEREAIRGLLNDPSDKVVISLLANRNITEDELLVLARRRNISGEALGMIAGMKAAARDYNLCAALANNPKTPRRMALSLIRKLRLRDMAFASQNKMLPTELRQMAEGILKDKLPVSPLGVRVQIARMVSEEVLKTLLLDDTPQQIRACFENPRMKEAVVIWAINRTNVPTAVIEFIAAHPKWSAYYSVRFALIRNPHTPIDRAVEMVAGLKALDQRYLYNDPSVRVDMKVRIELELGRKGQPLHPPKDEGRVIGIPGEEDGQEY